MEVYFPTDSTVFNNLFVVGVANNMWVVKGLGGGGGGSEGM